MEIPKDKADALEGLLQEHAELVKGQGTGFKWVLAFDVGEQAYSESLMQTFISSMRARYNESIIEESLTVTPTEGGSLLRVLGLSAMSKYCYNEDLTLLVEGSYSWMRKVIHASSMLPDELGLAVRSDVLEVNSASEGGVGAASKDSWFLAPKHYAIEKAYEYTHKASGASGASASDTAPSHRFRVRVLKEASDPYTSMKESKVSGARIRYIYELEIVDPSASFQQILKHVVYGIQVLTNSLVPITKTVASEVLKEYAELTDKSVDKNWREPDKVMFVAPKPITLEQRHLLPDSLETYGNTSILKGYCVTDKADGERMLLFINKSGKAYFINNDLEVRAASFHMPTISPTKGGTLLDGEYIPASMRKDGVTRDLFTAFDVYFFEGEPVYKYPLVTRATMAATGSQGALTTANDVRESDDKQRAGRTRYDILTYVCTQRHWRYDSEVHELRNKIHVHAEGDSMKDACRAILASSNTFPYSIDGLIFTPALLGVCSYYPGKTVNFPMSMRWDLTLKWKPAEQNTIDFLVVEVLPAIRDRASGKLYRRFDLYTGYNVSQMAEIRVKDGIRNRYTNTRKNDTSREEYIKRIFQPVSHFQKGVGQAMIQDNGGAARCQDGSILASDTIVEFAYDLNSKHDTVSKRWIPLRVREDKTRTYQRGKDPSRPNMAISKTANDFTVAASIWRSIHAPVTLAMLTGVEEVPMRIPSTLEERLLSVDDVYYAREVPRQHMLSVHMLNFHNNVVKSDLYKYSTKRDSLLELACGKAGDMSRWHDSEYTFVLGVDLVKDNICKASDGAYARMLKARKTLKDRVNDNMAKVFLNHVFAIGDCAKPIHDGSCTDDTDSKELLNVLYQRRARNRIDPIYTHINGAAANGFSVVSCQFAIHYFFKDESNLNGVLDNVSRNLKKDGLFILTFMDGELVHDLLMRNNGVAEGRKIDDKVRVWAILKRYPDDTYTSNNAIGKYVDVYLENTGRMIPEFLVHTPTLVSKLAERGLELVETQVFSHNFNKVLANPTSVNEAIRRDVRALQDDPVQTQFSFLNRWIVFRKK